jgi:uncharacterized BrkB/YihY/UPF0761 family membrane protein
MISQAIAFNVFLAFFPALLLAVGFASSWVGSKTATLEAIRNFTVFLPPGSRIFWPGGEPTSGNIRC